MIEQKKAEALAKKKSRPNIGPAPPLTPIQPNLPAKPSAPLDSSSSLVAELNKAAAKARQLASAHENSSTQAAPSIPVQTLNTESVRILPKSVAIHAQPASLSTFSKPVQTQNLSSFYGTSVSSATLSDQQKRLMEEKRKAALA